MRKEGKMGCGYSSSIVIETAIYDDDGDNVGELRGVVFNDRKSLEEWMVERGVTMNVISSILRTSSIYPIAILQHMKVEINQRGSGFGRDGMKYFLDCALEEGARTSLAIVDPREIQVSGFTIEKWMTDNGYAPMGYTQRGELVMFRRYCG